MFLRNSFSSDLRQICQSFRQIILTLLENYYKYKTIILNNYSIINKYR